MADYNSNYTGQKIDEAVEKTLSEVPEYWIPLDISGGVPSVPADKMAEVSVALYNPQNYNILGCKISGGGWFAGHRINDAVFSCPLMAELASGVGISGSASLIVYPTGGGNVTVEVVPDVFIVTLTPTAQDFSGTMDKTVAEINEAYEAGQKIVFRVLTSAYSYVDVPMSYAGRATAYQYPDFGAEIIQYSNNLMIVAHTGDTDNGTYNNYSTTIYPLTPM